MLPTSVGEEANMLRKLLASALAGFAVSATLLFAGCTSTGSSKAPYALTGRELSQTPAFAPDAAGRMMPIGGRQQ